MTQMDNSEPHNEQADKGVVFGEARFLSGSEFGNFEDADILTAARIRHFAESVLSAEAWFQTADELIAAMDLIGGNVEQFWEDYNSIIFGVDMTTDPPSRYQKAKLAPKHQETDVGTRHDLANQHMMLAGFAIENLCKGYLAGLLCPKEQDDVKAGKLPETLKTHNILKLVRSIGMTFSDREKDLLERIGVAIWRGRYPSPTDHKQIAPFSQWEDDVARIKTFLPRLRAHVGAKDS
jgi:hypothetical protein